MLFREESKQGDGLWFVSQFILHLSTLLAVANKQGNRMMMWPFLRAREGDGAEGGAMTTFQNNLLPKNYRVANMKKNNTFAIKKINFFQASAFYWAEKKEHLPHFQLCWMFVSDLKQFTINIIHPFTHYRNGHICTVFTKLRTDAALNKVRVLRNMGGNHLPTSLLQKQTTDWIICWTAVSQNVMMRNSTMRIYFWAWGRKSVYVSVTPENKQQATQHRIYTHTLMQILSLLWGMKVKLENFFHRIIIDMLFTKQLL